MRMIVTLLASVSLAHSGELHEAAGVCEPDRMRQLLSGRPPLNEADESGRTPLHVAIDSRQSECVWLLLKAGADGKARDRQGRSATDAAGQIADMRDRSVFVDMLWKAGQKMPRESIGPKPWSLEYSVMRRQTNVTAMLLAVGADPNATGTGGTTPLADAALKGDLDGVRLLLAHGARHSAISRASTQPIHDAALGDNAEVIRELVMHGADRNGRTRDGNQTPLHFTAAMGRMKAIEALVAHGADLTAKDSRGRTPRDVAEQAGLTDVMTILTGAGAAR